MSKKQQQQLDADIFYLRNIILYKLLHVVAVGGSIGSFKLKDVKKAVEDGYIERSGKGWVLTTKGCKKAAKLILKFDELDIKFVSFS